MKLFWKKKASPIYAVLLVLLPLFASQIYVRDNLALRVHSEMNNKIKLVIYGAVLARYGDLFAKDNRNTSGISDFRYIDRLIRLRSQLNQILQTLDKFDIIIYNYNNKIIYSNLDGKVDRNFKRTITMNHQEITLLETDDHSSYVSNDGEFISLFKINIDNNDHPIFLKIMQRPNAELIKTLENYYDTLIIITGMFLLMLAFWLYKMRKRSMDILNKQYETNYELEKAKELAENENMSKSRFLANVSHELRTPLNAIIGFSEIVLSDPQIKNTENFAHLNEIHNAGSDLLRIINDILDFSKAEANKLNIEIIEFDLSRIIESCIRMLSQKVDSKKVQLTYEKEDPEVRVSGDPQRTKQVLINLITNSIKFTENGFIKILARNHKKEGIVEIQVIDTGLGIAQENIYKVLAPFGQEDNQNSRKHSGTGLGLPLSKKLIELMNGSLKIESEKGKGTTVTLMIPMAKEEKDF